MSYYLHCHCNTADEIYLRVNHSKKFLYFNSRVESVCFSSLQHSARCLLRSARGHIGLPKIALCCLLSSNLSFMKQKSRIESSRVETLVSQWSDGLINLPMI